MKNVTNLKFKIELEGKGIVNYDSLEQKSVFYNEKSKNTEHLVSRYNNISYSKKNFYRNEDGELDYKIMISSNALRNNIFRNDMISQIPSLTYNKNLLYSFIASPVGLIRGYLFMSKDNTTYKRSSPLTISYAEQITNNKSYLEFCSRGGEKDEDKDKDKADTSIFNKETIGDIKYNCEGSINICDLQFISTDSVYDRCAFNIDEYDYFEKFIKLNIPNYEAEKGFFKLKTSVVNIGEQGVKLSNDTTMFLIKEILKRLLNIYITRATSYAKVSSLKIKLINNDNIFDSNGDFGWIEIESIEDINKLNFDIFDFYEIANDNAINDRKLMEIEAKNKKEAIKNKKKEDAEKAKKEREKKKKEADNKKND